MKTNRLNNSSSAKPKRHDSTSSTKIPIGIPCLAKITPRDARPSRRQRGTISGQKRCLPPFLPFTGTPGRGYTLTEAYYESTPGASINVGDRGTAVPEIDPASAGSVMSLVIGSLAMLERRRKLRAADASPTTVSA